uniref:HTH-type transcriptional regulator / antitoxin HigA n=1 Tax=Candidatus Kentrum sp. TC TaxID=2126339 RepID=A0A450ZTA6_9GAMM|nr:MAG: HTH-type transcriptional regulator / antitoxin HigA [Candidatus Kentron sp. TC]
MVATALEDACRNFARAVAPYLYITDDRHYEEVLATIETLLEKVDGSPYEPLNAIIGMLSHAIEQYENKDRELTAFRKRIEQQLTDLAVLRLLMDQHGLGMDDLPEIGSRSMVSRVLSGERSFSKKHIQKLSKRFGIDPGVFFK